MSCIQRFYFPITVFKCETKPKACRATVSCFSRSSWFSPGGEGGRGRENKTKGNSHVSLCNVQSPPGSVPSLRNDAEVGWGGGGSMGFECTQPEGQERVGRSRNCVTRHHVTVSIPRSRSEGYSTAFIISVTALF